MVLNILYIFSIIAFIIVIPVIIRKRRKVGATGIKSGLTSICFLLIALINIFAYGFDFIGLLTWSISIVLLILAAYFTRFLPATVSNN